MPDGKHNDAKKPALIDTLPTSKLLQEMKSHIDSSCPEKIDDKTTLDSISVFGDDTLQYNYSLVLDKAGIMLKR